MDKISRECRSRNMAAIRSSDTSMELLIRSALFAKGFRFRKNLRSLPGTPDIVFTKKKVAIFLDGCFWHGHSGCINGQTPKTNSDFWKLKISKNIERDSKNRTILREMGFVVLEYWECEIKKSIDKILKEICLLLS
jgi:DNA mismatch endonuclease (patch repair protein)